MGNTELVYVLKKIDSTIFGRICSHETMSDARIDIDLPAGLPFFYVLICSSSHWTSFQVDTETGVALHFDDTASRTKLDFDCIEKGVYTQVNLDLSQAKAELRSSFWHVRKNPNDQSYVVRMGSGNDNKQCELPGCTEVAVFYLKDNISSEGFPVSTGISTTSKFSVAHFENKRDAVAEMVSEPALQAKIPSPKLKKGQKSAPQASVPSSKLKQSAKRKELAPDLTEQTPIQHCPKRQRVDSKVKTVVDQPMEVEPSKPLLPPPSSPTPTSPQDPLQLSSKSLFAVSQGMKLTLPGRVLSPSVPDDYVEVLLSEYSLGTGYAQVRPTNSKGRRTSVVLLHELVSAANDPNCRNHFEYYFAETKNKAPFTTVTPPTPLCMFSHRHKPTFFFLYNELLCYIAWFDCEIGRYRP